MARMAAWTSRGSQTRRTLGFIRKELVEVGIRQRLIAALFKLPDSGVNLFDQLLVRQNSEGLLPALKLSIVHKDGSSTAIFGNRDLFAQSPLHQPPLGSALL